MIVKDILDRCPKNLFINIINDAHTVLFSHKAYNINENLYGRKVTGLDAGNFILVIYVTGEE